MAGTAQHTEGIRLTVFAPGARSLTDEEIRALPADKREAAAATGTEGVWLEVPCSREECLSDKQGIAIPVQGVTEKERGRLLGHVNHRRLGTDAVVPVLLLAVPARLGVQHRRARAW